MAKVFVFKNITLDKGAWRKSIKDGGAPIRYLDDKNEQVRYANFFALEAEDKVKNDQKSIFPSLFSLSKKRLSALNTKS